MQLFQQWLQVAASTLHLEELEEQKRGKGDRRQDEEPDDRERSGSDSGLFKRPMYGQYEQGRIQE